MLFERARMQRRFQTCWAIINPVWAFMFAHRTRAHRSSGTNRWLPQSLHPDPKAYRCRSSSRDYANQSQVKHQTGFHPLFFTGDISIYAECRLTIISTFQCFQQLYRSHTLLLLNYDFLSSRSSVFMSSVVVFSLFIFGNSRILCFIFIEWHICSIQVWQ